MCAGRGCRKPGQRVEVNSLDVGLAIGSGTKKLLSDSE